MSAKAEMVNVGIPRQLHREMSQFVERRGMKLRSLPAVLWVGFKMLSQEQVNAAQEQAGRFARRKVS